MHLLEGTQLTIFCSDIPCVNIISKNSIITNLLASCKYWNVIIPCFRITPLNSPSSSPEITILEGTSLSIITSLNTYEIAIPFNSTELPKQIIFLVYELVRQKLNLATMLSVHATTILSLDRKSCSLVFGKSGFGKSKLGKFLNDRNLQCISDNKSILNVVNSKFRFFAGTTTLSMAKEYCFIDNLNNSVSYYDRILIPDFYHKFSGKPEIRNIFICNINSNYNSGQLLNYSETLSFIKSEFVDVNYNPINFDNMKIKLPLNGFKTNDFHLNYSYISNLKIYNIQGSYFFIQDFIFNLLSSN